MELYFEGAKNIHKQVKDAFKDLFRKAKIVYNANIYDTKFEETNPLVVYVFPNDKNHCHVYHCFYDDFDGNQEFVYCFMKTITTDEDMKHVNELLEKFQKRSEEGPSGDVIDNITPVVIELLESCWRKNNDLYCWRWNEK